MQSHPEYPLDTSPTAEPVDKDGKKPDPYADVRPDLDVNRGPNRKQRRAVKYGRLK